MNIITDEAKTALISGYTYTDPCQFIVIDNFFQEEIANRAYRTLLDFNFSNADYKSVDLKFENNKYNCE